MGLKTFWVDFLEVSKENSNRFDVNFIDFNKIEKHNTCSFSDFFDIQKFEKKDRLLLLEDLNEDFYYAEIGNATKQGDVIPEKLNLDDRNEFVADYFKKIDKGDIQKVEIGNILLAKVRPNLKKYILIDDEKEKYFYTTAFINLKPKKLGKIFYYLLRTIFYKNLMAIARQGKGYPTLKEDDLFTLRFDKKIINSLENKQYEIIAQIEPIEKKIKELKSQIKEPQEIINKVFAREFGFDLEKFGELKKIKFIEVDFSKLSNYFSLRFDVKNQKYLDVFNDIIRNFGSYFTLKSISKDQGKYGANEPAKDGKKGFDIRYIRITDIDSIGNLTDYDWKTAENIDEQYLLKDNNFLFARSGNTVGKTFLYNSNKHEKAIYAGYFIKFQLDFTNLNKLFFLYYTKSFIYDFWVKGIVRIKGQPNINANEYLELKIPNIPLKQQQEIVDEIKAEVDKQEEIKKQIENKRNKIDEIIEKVIKSS